MHALSAIYFHGELIPGLILGLNKSRRNEIGDDKLYNFPPGLMNRPPFVINKPPLDDGPLPPSFAHFLPSFFPVLLIYKYALHIAPPKIVFFRYIGTRNATSGFLKLCKLIHYYWFVMYF